jgi:hypothetical protein
MVMVAVSVIAAVCKEDFSLLAAQKGTLTIAGIVWRGRELMYQTDVHEMSSRFNELATPAQEMT